MTCPNGGIEFASDGTFCVGNGTATVNVKCAGSCLYGGCKDCPPQFRVHVAGDPDYVPPFNTGHPDPLYQDVPGTASFNCCDTFAIVIEIKGGGTTRFDDTLGWPWCNGDNTVYYCVGCTTSGFTAFFDRATNKIKIKLKENLVKLLKYKQNAKNRSLNTSQR